MDNRVVIGAVLCQDHCYGLARLCRTRGGLDRLIQQFQRFWFVPAAVDQDSQPGQGCGVARLALENRSIGCLCLGKPSRCMVVLRGGEPVRYWSPGLSTGRFAALFAVHGHADTLGYYRFACG